MEFYNLIKNIIKSKKRFYLCICIVNFIIILFTYEYELNKDQFDRIFYQKYHIPHQDSVLINGGYQIGFDKELYSRLRCGKIDSYSCQYLGGKIIKKCALQVNNENNKVYFYYLYADKDSVKFCKKKINAYYLNVLKNYNKFSRKMISSMEPSLQNLSKLYILIEEGENILKKVNNITNEPKEIIVIKEKIPMIYLYKNTILVSTILLCLFIILSLTKLFRYE